MKTIYHDDLSATRVLKTKGFTAAPIHSTIGERSFQSAAASTWNALPHSVRSSTSMLQFRSRLNQNYSRVHTGSFTEFVSASL